MAVDWSDNIVLAQLNDEPALSDELAGLTDRLSDRAAGEPSAEDPDAGFVPSVVVDFSNVSYINSSNIAQLLQLKRVLDGAGKQLCLAAMTEEVWSVMMVTGLEKVFMTAPDTLTALASLQLSEADMGDDEG